MAITVTDVRAIIKVFTCKIRNNIFPNNPVVLSEVSKGPGNHRSGETLEAAIQRRHCVFNLQDLMSHFENNQYFPGEVEGPESILQLDEQDPTSFEEQKNMVLLALCLAARVGAFNSIEDGQGNTASLQDAYIDIIADKIHQWSQETLDRTAWYLIHFKASVERANGNLSEIEPVLEVNAKGTPILREGELVQRVVISSETCVFLKSFNLHTVPTPVSPYTGASGIRSQGYLKAGQVFPNETKELIKNVNDRLSPMKGILHMAEFDIEFIQHAYEEIQVISNVVVSEEERKKQAEERGKHVLDSNQKQLFLARTDKHRNNKFSAATQNDMPDVQTDCLSKLSEELKLAQSITYKIKDFVNAIENDFITHMQKMAGKQGNGTYGEMNRQALTKELNEFQALIRKTSIESLMEKNNRIVKCREHAEIYRKCAIAQTDPTLILTKTKEIEQQAKELVEGNSGALNWAMTSKAITQGLVNRANPNISSQIADATTNSHAAMKNYALAKEAQKEILGDLPQSIRQKTNAECEKAALILTQYNNSRLKYVEQFSEARAARDPYNVGFARQYKNLAEAKAAEEAATNAARLSLTQAKNDINDYKPHITTCFQQLRQLKTQLGTVKKYRDYSWANYKAVCDMQNAADTIKL